MTRTSNAPGCVPGVLITIAVLVFLAAHATWGQGVVLNILDQNGNLACSLPSNGGYSGGCGGGGGGGAVLLAPQVPLCAQPAYQVTPPQCERTLVIIGGDRRRGHGWQHRYQSPPQWGYGYQQTSPWSYGQPILQYYGGYGYGGYGGNLGGLEAQNEDLQRQLDAAQRYRDAQDRNARLREELGRYGY